MAAKSLNKVMLLGHAGKDTEIRYSGSGMAIGNFTLATNDMRKDKATGQPIERTEWHNIVVFDRLAEICRDYVKKGKRIYIEGRIQAANWEDKDGNKHYKTEIVANDMILLDGGTGQNPGGEQRSYRQASNAPAAGPTPAPVPEYEPQEAAPVDDLPF
ncbi:MAG TPA: single-stranded DNA-binding protein [Candidatus Kapabacteria bacterium]|nr:single-stranded DNA-binding protein [Candidatus Kapabacteria bacterium]